jgi:type II secretion system protein J
MIKLMSEKEGAFTLIEIMVSCAIVVILAGALYQIFLGSSAAWQKGEARTRMYQNARLILDLMNREIRASFISRGDPHLVFKGNESFLTFVSASNIPNTTGEYDLRQIEYSLSQERLLRRIETSLDSFSGGATAMVGEQVLNLSFSYWGQDQWQGFWDSTKGTSDGADDSLPEAVKITISTQDEEAHEPRLILSTVVYLPVRR